MKIILFALYGFCCVITTNSRLMDSVKERTLPTDTKTVSSPPLRLARQIDASREDDGLTGVSEEDRFYSDELRRSQKKRGKYSNKPKSVLPKLSRIPRGSGEHIERSGGKNSTATTSSNTPVTHSRPKSKPIINKKPIPKYNEMDYDDDFQMKVNKSPVKVIDSGEHEDEDFNLNDYDFDVNHDEFVGRGKPLEPRTKNKETRENYTLKPESKSAGSDNKSKGKSQPAQHKSSKKERSAENFKRPGDKEDYYDDTSSTTKPKINEKPRDLEDEFNEENDESKEFEAKTSTRLVRSPKKMHALMEKYGENHGMSKILSILPMFPQLPARHFEYNTGNEPRFTWALRNKE